MDQQKTMQLTIRIEEAAITLLSIYFLSKYNLGLSVWVWISLFFSPDISMLGYLFNTRVGAITYNLFHHKGIAIAIMAAGLVLQNNLLISIGLLLLAHSSFDRMMGFGLKFSDGFNHTHLGGIGKSIQANK